MAFVASASQRNSRQKGQNRMQLTRSELDKIVDQAGADLYEKAGGKTQAVTPDLMLDVAEKHRLPIGANITNDVVARTIFIAAFCGEALDALKAGKDAVWHRLEQLAAQPA